jgi:DNA repair protein RadC
LAHEQFEVFGVLWLDNRHKVLETVNLFNGTTDGGCVACADSGADGR